jgi:hypothetical protein
MDGAAPAAPFNNAELTGGRLKNNSGAFLLPCVHAPRRWAEEDQEGAHDLPFCDFPNLVCIFLAYRIGTELNANGEEVCSLLVSAGYGGELGGGRLPLARAGPWGGERNAKGGLIFAREARETSLRG